MSNCISDSKVKLRDYQILAVKQIMMNSLLVFHSAGTGKTLIMVTAGQCLSPVPVIIITTKGLKQQLDKTFDTYGVSEPDRKRYRVITKEEFLKIPSSEFKNKVMMVDEAHFLKGSITNESTDLLPTGKAALHLIDCGSVTNRNLILTATPTSNSESDILTLLTVIRQESKFPMTAATFTRLARTDPKALIPLFQCRVSYYQVDPSGGNFPQKTVTRLNIPMNNDMYRAYRDMELKIDVDDAFYTRKREDANMLTIPSVHPKFKTALDIVQKLGKQTVIYHEYLDKSLVPMKQLLDQNKIKNQKITGEETPAARTSALNNFNDGKIPVLLLSSAGSTGVDVKNGQILIVFDAPWNPSKLTQIEDRIYRQGGLSHLPEAERKVTIYELELTKPDLLSRDYDDQVDSVDTILYETIASKRQNLDAFTRNVLIPASIEANPECYLQPAKRQKV